MMSISETEAKKIELTPIEKMKQYFLLMDEHADLLKRNIALGRKLIDDVESYIDNKTKGI